MDTSATSLLIQKIRAIHPVNDNSISLLLGNMKRILLRKNDWLLKEGQVCKQVFYVNQGLVKTYYNKEGKDINLGFTMENNFLTNLRSLRSGEPSDSNIRAMEASDIFAIDRDSLLSLYQNANDIAQFGRSLLELLLAEQEDQNNMFRLQTPAERYHHIEKYNPALLQRVSQTQLASWLGLSRETLSRIRKQPPVL